MSLVENLVALALLALALLGMAVLSNAALSAARGNVYRQAAIHLADDLGNRLFAHLRGRGIGDSAVADCSAVTAACLRSTDALAELEAWRSDVAAALPDGRGLLAVTAGAERLYLEIRVAWSAADSSTAEHSLQMAAPW